MQKVLEPIQRVRFTKSTLRQASIREKKGPSLGKIRKINVKIPHQRTPTLWHLRTGPTKTERQQRCSRSKDWNLANNIFKLKEKDKAAFYFPAEEWVLPATSTKEPEEREFVVDSGAGMQKVSKIDMNSAELETMRTSRSPTTVMTANGEVQTREEATEDVKQLDLFVKVMLLEETPAVLSLGKLCEDHGGSYHWTSGRKPYLTRNGKRIDCNISNYEPFVVPGLSASSASTTPSPFSSSSSSQDSLIDVNRCTENPEPERSGSTSGDLRWDPLHESTEIENKKWGTRRSTKRQIAWVAWLATGTQREFGGWKYFNRALEWTQSKEVKTLPSHLMNFQWSCELKWNWILVSTVYIRTFRRIQLVISAWKRKWRASCRRRAGTVAPRAEHFWWLDYSGSKNSQWRKWIAEQSSICRGCTRFGNTVDTIIPE